jgi:hypothetical protein
MPSGPVKVIVGLPWLTAVFQSSGARISTLGVPGAGW